MSPLIAALLLAAAPPVQLHGMAEGGVRLDPDPQPAKPAASFYLSFARLQVRYEPEALDENFGAMLQLEGRTGEIQVLDIVARAGARKGPHLVFGRMKVPVSPAFMVPAHELLVPRRGLEVSLVPRRLTGTMASAPIGPLKIEAGVFDPVGFVPDGTHGALGMTAIDLKLPAHMVLHGAASLVVNPDAESPRDLTLDLALAHRTDESTFALELIGAHRLAGAWDLGLNAVLAHRLKLDALPFEVEPAVEWSSRIEDAELAHRAALALNFHQSGWHLVHSLAYQADLTDRLASAFFAQTQVRF